MNALEYIVHHKVEFLKFLKSKFPLYHLSNIFFRDLHFGVSAFLKQHGKKVSYTEAETVAHAVGDMFEKDGTFKRIDHQSWLLMYPDFALPRAEKKAS